MKLLWFLIFGLTQAQQLGIKLCSDDVCASNCVSWTATSGRCSPCDIKLGPCSLTNPSTIVTSSSMSFYSDSECNDIIVDAQNMNLLIGSGCNVLVGSYGQHLGSYELNNITLILSGALGGLLLLCCTCCICFRTQADLHTKIQASLRLRQKQAVEPYQVPYSINDSYGPIPSAPEDDPSV